jgi:hypothetical protein
MGSVFVSQCIYLFTFGVRENMATRFFWKSLLVTPAVLGAALIASSGAIAAESQEAVETLDTFAAVELDSLDAFAPVELDIASVESIVEAETAVEVAQAAPVDSSSLNQVIEYANESNVNSMGQVTSITQLSDVRPTDWAFQALQSLVERYGCIAGYPDGTYRGQQAMTRFEFAAGLNACLDRINEIIAAGLADVVTREDLAAIQRLQEEFAAELATLRGRVDALEARVDELEANQFSTTTKLSGTAIFNVAAEFADVADDQATFGYRVRQNFDTSFTGNDRLRVRLQARNIRDFAADPIGFSFSGDSNNSVELSKLLYDFPLTDNIDIRIGGRGLNVDDLVASTISPLDSGDFGSLSGFGAPPQYGIAVSQNAGAGIIFQLSDSLSLDMGYTAGRASDPTPGRGLFNGSYSAVGQLTFLGSNFQAAFNYVHTFLSASDNPSVSGVAANTYGFQANVPLGNFEIGGGVAYAHVIELGAADVNVWSYQGTLALNDLGGQGNKLMLLAGVLPYTRSSGFTRPNSFFEPSANFQVRPNGNTSFLVELSYLFRVNDRIAITPGLIWIDDANEDRDDAFIGALRTTFSF